MNYGPTLQSSDLPRRPAADAYEEWHRADSTDHDAEDRLPHQGWKREADPFWLAELHEAMSDSAPQIASRAKQLSRELTPEIINDEHRRWMWLGERLATVQSIAEHSSLSLETHMRDDRTQFAALTSQVNQVNIAIHADETKDARLEGEARGAREVWGKIRKWAIWAIPTGIAGWAAWKSK